MWQWIKNSIPHFIIHPYRVKVHTFLVRGAPFYQTLNSVLVDEIIYVISSKIDMKLTCSWVLSVFLWIPACMSNYIHHKGWDIITYPLPNFNGCTVEVSQWISYFIPQSWRVCLSLSIYYYYPIIHAGIVSRVVYFSVLLLLLFTHQVMIQVLILRSIAFSVFMSSSLSTKSNNWKYNSLY